MSMQLLNAIIHKLEKDAGEPAKIIDAKACLNVSEEPLQALVEQVHTVYQSKESKSYGKFDPDLSPVSAEPHLLLLRDNPKTDFLALSLQLMRVLKDKSDGQNFATGGHVLIAESKSNETRWLIVVILNNKAGTSINEKLQVVKAPHLDIEGIRFAGRINFNEWSKAEADRYISFLKGKKNDVSLYFQKFLGCSEVQQDLNDTRNLVKAVKHFALEQGLTEVERENLLNEVYKFAEVKAAEKQPLSLTELSNRVWAIDPEILKTSLAQSDPPISDGFTPNKRGLSGLKKFSAKGTSWKLEFDREAIQNRTISFDPEEETLTISKLPSDVIANLRAEFATDGSEDENTAQ